MFEQLRQALDEQPVVQGISMTDVMALPDPLRGAVKRIMHGGSHTLSALAGQFAVSLAETRVLAEIMVEKGLLTAARSEPDGETVYRVRLAGTRPRIVPANLLEPFEDG